MTSRRSPAEFIIAAVAVAVIGLFIFIGSSNGDDQAPPSGDRAAAWDACKQAVTGQLANPSSADFALLSTDFAEQNGGWSITGSVTADNDFGAEIELGYSCAVDADGSVEVEVAR